LTKSLQWRELSNGGKAFLLTMYVAAIPSAYVCLGLLPGRYSLPWLLLTLSSLLLASVTLRLPKSATVVISMGDVFAILALIHFGAGPALVTLWIDTIAACVADYSRRHGIHFYRKILLHRFIFNLSACPLAMLAMGLAYRAPMTSDLPFPANMALGLALVALSWFVVNTVTLAAGVSFWSGQRFLAVWKNAVGLYLLNFFGSAAIAGLISLFYQQGDVYVFLFAVPVSILLYRLYRYHVEQYEQAQQHINQLNELYQQAIQTQEAQRRSEERYRSLVEAASDAIFSLSPDHTITSLNSAFQKITGWVGEDWIGRRFEDLMHGDDAPAAEETLSRVFQGETLLLPEVRLRRKSGDHVVVECTMTAHMQDGQLIGLLGIARDMTERKRLEDTLRQSQKMEAIGRLAGGIAHDFNNLLVVIIGYSDLLLGEMDKSSSDYHKLDEVRKAGERAAALTRQLLAFSRKQIIEPVPVNLNSIVTNMNKMLRRVIGEDIELANVLQPNLGIVKADPGQLEQVILNLAVNSRDAMPTGGTVTIQTGNAADFEVSEAVKTQARAGDYVMLSVTDTGTGIPDHIQGLIFEPFFTTKEHGKGTGLGLATVYGIVNQSGGYLALDSAPGQGTSFRIFFPRIHEEVKQGEPQPVTRTIRAKETVLLVEDEDVVRCLASTILNRSGYHVLEARACDQALRISLEHSGPIHALVTDVVMPQMSGPQLAEMIQTIRTDIKILYMSGYTDELISHHGVLDSGTLFLQKPFSPETFARKMHELLKNPSSLTNDKAPPAIGQSR
jgi:PAS domain S-box-containing protein